MEEINGQHYIFIEDVEYYENVDTDWHFCSFFDSVQDFVGKITAGKPLGHSAYIDIAKHFEKDDIGVKICDPNNLYVPILPDNMAEVMFSWEGESYMYAIYGLEKQADRNADGLIGYIYYHTKEAWEKRQDIIISRSEKQNIRTLENGNKKVTLIITSTSVEAFFYEAEKELYYDLFVCYQYSWGNNIPDIEEWYSDEWLLSFGMEKYVEQPAE